MLIRGQIIINKKTKKKYKIFIIAGNYIEVMLNNKIKTFTKEEFYDTFTLQEKFEISYHKKYGYYVSVIAPNRFKYLTDKGNLEDTTFSTYHNGWFKSKELAKQAINKYLSKKSV